MNLNLFVRLVRLQFVPVMIMPVVLGAATAWFAKGLFDPWLFLLVLLGAVFLHMAANAIDDVYDFVNGVDPVSDKMFPRDAPGWKPVARGVVTLGEGRAVAGAFYGASLLIGLYLSLIVGWPALGIAIPGIFLSYIYTAPPVKLDYRGKGLGELSILLSFGPIPSLGTYYVLTHQLSALPVLASVSTGLLTTCVLIAHDLIFLEPYKATGKATLAVRLGSRRATKLVSGLALLAYAIVVALALLGMLPLTALLVLLALPITAKLLDFKGKERTPPEYGSRTVMAFVQSVAFTGLLALGLII